MQLLNGIYAQRPESGRCFKSTVLGVMFALPLLLASAMATATGAAEVHSLLNQAESQLALGIAEKGAGDGLEKAMDLVAQAETTIQRAAPTQREKAGLQREARELREQLEVMIELYQDRFYAAYPLTRLLLPTLLKDEGFAVEEQLFHPPEIAAVEVAARKFSSKVAGIDTPKIVVRSQPGDVVLENVALSTLSMEGATIPINRRALFRTLGSDGLAEFDAGNITQSMLTRLMSSLNTESLLVATVQQGAGNKDDLVMYGLLGHLYLRGEALSGSPADASPAVRVSAISSWGMVVDRRAQFWPILLLEAGMLLAAIGIAARTRWSVLQPLKPLYRMAVGAGLYVYGRGFIIAVITLMGSRAPDPSDMVAAGWWWPALLGLNIVVLPGLLAWLGQARMTEVIPGSRGARAVGTIFGLSALGCASYFVAPILLMQETAGYLSLALFVFSCVGLAILFAFAVRTGPPVPLWFAPAPLLVAPLLGTALLMLDIGWLAGIAAVTTLLYLAATARHRYAVAHGIEEPEPSEEAAAEADQERLMKLRAKLKK